jgi:hypothetical protein
MNLLNKRSRIAKAPALGEAGGSALHPFGVEAKQPGAVMRRLER